jgi:hypothetical protein
VEGNIVTGAQAHGGGFHSNDMDITMRNCTFRNNALV